LQEIIHEKYGGQLFAVLIPALEPRCVPIPSPLLPLLASLPKLTSPRRVHSHAAAALINFCEGVERNTLLPYLDPIVERPLKLLNPANANANQNPKQPKRYVQEQAITTLAMVADAGEATFAKVCFLL
jgi:hypothetical protein